MTRRFLILNGPNLNMLGTREPEIYGFETIADLEKLCLQKAEELGVTIDFRQSNHEGQLIDWIQEAKEGYDGILINPAAYSHTSIALLDALQAVNKPTVEVHLSNIHKRETFRHHSYVSSYASSVLCGLGPKGYAMGLEALVNLVKS